MKQNNFLKRLLAKNEQRHKSVLLYLFAFVLLLGTQNVLAQEREISGKVVDDTNSPLPGASIILKGTTIGTQSDFDGLYQLSVPQDAILVISSLGFVTQEIEIGAQSVIDVQLVGDATSLDEVVVIGYGTARKSDLTGSVGSMKAEEISKQPVARIDQALQGRIAGVQVTSVSGAPGSGASIRIRGGNSINAGNEPLYVIDGFIGVGDLNSISPNDIESIEVLKDASSTSIYGSRGSNGVILITTKRGKGKGAGISFDSYVGIQTPVKKLDLLNGREFAEFVNEKAELDGSAVPFPDVNAVANTDWQDILFRDALITNNTLSFYNSTEKTNYFVSLNYFNQQGIQLGSSFNRYQLRFNIDHRMGKYFKVGASMNASLSTRENPRATALKGGALPSAPIYNEDGTFFSVNQINGGTFNSPVAEDQLRSNDTHTNSQLGNLYVLLNPIKGLEVKTTFGFSFPTVKQNIYTSANMPTNFEANKGGEAIIRTSFTKSLQNENTVSYTKDIGDHNFDVLGGFTYQDFDIESTDVEAVGFTNDVTEYHAIETGDPSQLKATSDNTNWTLLSALYRLNYGYKSKYLVTLSGRNDGSSRLSEENKWQFFPSAAVAWKISDESFFEPVNVISNLKLRASWGVTGSQSIDPYATLARLQTGINYIGGTQVVSYIPGIAASPNLKWEVTNQVDIGVEMGLFDRKLNIEFDYYKKETEDLLLERILAGQTGFESRLENVGSLQNEGFDLSINGNIFDKEDFSWSSTLTLSTNKNKVLNLAGDREYIENGQGSRIIVGESIGTFYGVKFIGLWQEGDAEIGTNHPGEPKFEDLNGDGLIDVNDGQIMGDATPDYYGGLNNVLSYKNFTMSVFIDFSVGNDIYDLDGGNFNAAHTTNVYGHSRDRWTPENTNSNIPRAGSDNLLWGNYASANNGKGNSFFIHDGSYLRLKNINLQYKVPEVSKVFNNLTIYGSATNVLTLTGYDGFSPDVSSEGTHSTRRGFDSNGFPPAKVFLLGIKADF